MNGNEETIQRNNPHDHERTNERKQADSNPDATSKRRRNVRCKAWKRKPRKLTPRARAITKQTEDVRVDVKLNKAVWSKGIRNVPKRVRVQISRKRNDNEDAKVRDLEETIPCVRESEGNENEGPTLPTTSIVMEER